MIKIGNADIVNIYVGSDEVSKIYIGNTEVWSASSGSPIDYSTQYFTIEAISAGTITWGAPNLYYSVDNGTTWNTWDNANGYSVNAGDKIMFKSDTNTRYSGYTITSTAEYQVYGNTMSLFYGDNFENQTTLPNTTNHFRQLFFNTPYLINAGNLILPATTLKERCYYEMFRACYNIVSVPNLPATTLANYCYQGMFNACELLINVPALPVTSLAQYCYQDMFRGCTSLINAPELPATTLVNYCYKGMFSGCKNLAYIKCLATDISATQCTSAWVQYITNTNGTFVKSPNMNDWTYDISKVPSGWTIVDA